MDASSILDFIGECALFLSVIRAVTVINVGGWRCWRSIALMMGISLRGPQLFIVASAIMILIFTLTSAFTSPIRSFATPLFDFGVASYLLVRIWSPPAILYLSASKRRGFGLLIRLRFLASPLKVAHLLIIYPHVSLIGHFIVRLVVFGLDEYRVFWNWQNAVRSLSQVASIIIIDARTPSPALTEELTHNASAGLNHRTFIVYDEHGLDERGCVPGLGGISYPLYSELRLVPSIQFPEAMAGLWWSWLTSRRINLPQLLENRILKVKRLWGSVKDDAGRCSMCRMDLLRVRKWDDELTREQSEHLHSYSNILQNMVFQCRECGVRYCSECAFKSRLRCHDCDSLSLRTGFVAVPKEWL